MSDSAAPWTVACQAPIHSPTLPPCSILDTFPSGDLIFQCRVLSPFHTVRGVPEARIPEWSAILSSSGTCFVRTLHCDLFVLGSPARHAS